MHGRQLSKVGFRDVDVQRLALVNEGTAISRHFQDDLLGYFPDSFIQLLQVRRKVQILD
jgi:hypothetical protein